MPSTCEDSRSSPIGDVERRRPGPAGGEDGDRRHERVDPPGSSGGARGGPARARARRAPSDPSPDAAGRSRSGNARLESVARQAASDRAAPAESSVSRAAIAAVRGGSVVPGTRPCRRAASATVTAAPSGSRSSPSRMSAVRVATCRPFGRTAATVPGGRPEGLSVTSARPTKTKPSPRRTFGSARGFGCGPKSRARTRAAISSAADLPVDHRGRRAADRGGRSSSARRGPARDRRLSRGDATRQSAKDSSPAA